MGTVSAIIYGIFGLGGLAAVIYAVRSVKAWGNAELKQEIAENESKSYKDRAKIEDNISKSSALDKRLRLRKWLRRI